MRNQNTVTESVSIDWTYTIIGTLALITASYLISYLISWIPKKKQKEKIVAKVEQTTELELATLKEIMLELSKRGYSFIFAGYKDKNTNDTMYWLNTPEFITPIHLCQGIIDICAEALEKERTDYRILNLLFSIQLILETMFSSPEGKEE